jgi:LysR family hydrogen peroxide-inducible transcriptional activator
MGIALLPEMAVKGGILNGTTLIARPLAPPAPKRVIALVARLSTAHQDEFQALAQSIESRFKSTPRISRGSRKSFQRV